MKSRGPQISRGRKERKLMKDKHELNLVQILYRDGVTTILKLNQCQQPFKTICSNCEEDLD